MGGVESGSGSGLALGLVHLAERPGARPVISQGRWGLYHFALLLPDRKETWLATNPWGTSVRLV